METFLTRISEINSDKVLNLLLYGNPYVLKKSQRIIIFKQRVSDFLFKSNCFNNPQAEMQATKKNPQKKHQLNLIFIGKKIP